MGLDMYLSGEKRLKFGVAPEIEDDYQVEMRVLELGYWRKHPNLHGYIVNNFADGKDECQKIELGVINLRQLLQAVLADDLPHTTGFFFGTSLPEQKAETIEILQKAIKWAETEDKNCYRSIVYQASW